MTNGWTRTLSSPCLIRRISLDGKKSETRILITGGAGFIGGCLVRQWIANEEEYVVNLDKLTYAGNLTSLASVTDHERYSFVHGDIGDINLTRELLQRHQPTAIHMRSLITQHHKLTVYRDQDYGELYDLEQDPGELKNHWSDPAYAQRKSELLRHFINAELKREPTPMPRISSA